MGRQVHSFTCDRLSYVFVPFDVVDLISFCGGAKNDIWVLHIVCSWAVRAPANVVVLN
jgi:predicted phosphoadenosine phosphosulfate sulfurtransferase